MKDLFAAFSVWLRVQFFRLWTAAAVLAAFGTHGSKGRNI